MDKNFMLQSDLAAAKLSYPEQTWEKGLCEEGPICIIDKPYTQEFSLSNPADLKQTMEELFAHGACIYGYGEGESKGICVEIIVNRKTLRVIEKKDLIDAVRHAVMALE